MPPKFLRLFTFSLSLAGLLLATSSLAAPSKNGFDLSRAQIPVDKILQGGPPKDGIPAINQPRFVSAEQAQLAPEAQVLGLVYQGEARAYPINILNWHEIVNDWINDEPIAITWCPLCGSGVAFRRTVDRRPLSFGVSGLLYNSDVLMYDHQSESLWSQLKASAVSGVMAGKQLEHVPLQHMRWKDWLARHPDTQVLSQETGYRRDYSRDPYRDYLRSTRLFFPVDNQSERYHPKEEVVGLALDGAQKAWPFVELDKQGKARFEDTIGEQVVTVEWHSEQRSVRIYDREGNLLPANRMFWFAWVAFNPDAAVFAAD